MRTGLVAAIVAVALFLAAAGVGLALVVVRGLTVAPPSRTSIRSPGSPANRSAPSKGSSGSSEEPSGAAAPAWAAAKIAEAYPGWVVEAAFRSTDAVILGDRTVTAILRSGATKGFRHSVVFDITSPPGGPDSLAAQDDAFFQASAYGYLKERDLSFERLWVKDHGDLICGRVYEDADRELPSPLAPWRADAFATAGARTLIPAATFSLRYNVVKETWDTSESNMLPPRTTPAKAIATAKKRLPAFRVVTTVSDPAAVDPGIGEVFVVMRHPSFPGFLLVVDPLEGSVDGPSLFADDNGSAPRFFQKLDTRSRAFASDWARLHPGTVVFEIDDYSESGRAFDDVGVRYYTAVAAVGEAAVPEDAELVYDRAKKRWHEVPMLFP